MNTTTVGPICTAGAGQARPWTFCALLAMLGLLAHAEALRWNEGKQTYHAVEHGRVIRLIQLDVLTDNPFNPSLSTLVEPRAGAVARQGDPVPCWPDDDVQRTQKLLSALYRTMPDYRILSVLDGAARSLNRGVGTFREAWIVGTHPLAVAFLDGPPDQVPPEVQERIDRVRKVARPTTLPGVFEIVTRSGEVVPADFRCRDSRLVSDSDLNLDADVVLLFPEGASLRAVDSPKPSATQPALRAKVLHLPAPQSLRSIMRGLIQLDEFERQAKEVIEIPVGQL